MWRFLFHWLITKPVLLLIVGLNVRNPERIPRHGPAIVVANHNSHADTIALTSLFPTRVLPKVRPVAAADYFLRNRAMSWFSRDCLGILPIDRGETLILFPEGSRGEPERLQRFKKGIFHLARQRPEVPIVPIYLHGLGKVLPKGTFVPLPLFCDAFVGPPLPDHPERADEFVSALEAAMARLIEGTRFPEWD